MHFYCALDQGNSPGPIIPETSASRYAWLEHEKGYWHFLVGLFADVQESTRRWPTKNNAFDELNKEGWVVIGSYPENSSMPQKSCGEALGYGLMWIGQ